MTNVQYVCTQTYHFNQQNLITDDVQWMQFPHINHQQMYKYINSFRANGLQRGISSAVSHNLHSTGTV